MYETVTRYIDRLMPAERRTVERGGHNYCFLEYDKWVRAYSKDVHALLKSDAPDFREFLTSYNMEVTDNLTYINIASLSAQTILYLLMFIENAEHKSAGFRSEFIRNGFINDALKRLRDLDM